MPNEIDPTTGTTAANPQGGSGAKPTGTAGSAGAGGSAGTGESADELRTRLAEAERKAAQLLSEKTNVEDERRKIAERQRELDERERAMAQAPPNNAGAGLLNQSPLEQRVAALNNLIAQYGENSEAGLLAATQRDLLVASFQQAQREAAWRKAEDEIANLPADEQPKVRARLRTGMYGSVEAAVQAVRGESANDLQKQVKELQEQLKDAQAAAGKPVGVGGAGIQAATPNGVQQVRASEHAAEYEKLIAAGSVNEAMKLVRAVETGKRVLIPG